MARKPTCAVCAEPGPMWDGSDTCEDCLKDFRKAVKKMSAFAWAAKRAREFERKRVQRVRRAKKRREAGHE